MKTKLFLIIFIFIAACTTQSLKIEERDEVLPRVQANGDLFCPRSDVKRCSISSPLQDKAEEIFLEASTGSKRQLATILDIGEKALIARLHLIRAAKESISMQTYLWSNSDVGSLFVRELLAAAKRGVKVRIIGDQLFSGNNPKNLAAAAQAHENFQIKLYNPINQKSTVSKMEIIKKSFSDFGTLNHRMHNKIMVFDDRIGITGGRNIGDEYFDWSTEFNFIDRDVLVVGAAATEMQKSFDQYWDDPITVDLDQVDDVRQHLFVEDKQQILPLPDFPDLSGFEEIISRSVDSEYIKKEFIEKSHSVSDVVFTADRPQKPFVKDDEADLNTSRRLGEALRSAKRSVLMQTPYVIISSSAYRFFKEIRANHPDIKYTVTTNSLASVDHYIIYSLAFKRKKRNVKNLKFRIHELKPKPADIENLIPRYSTLAQLQPSADADGSYQYDPEEPLGHDRYETVPITTKGPRVSIHAKSMVIDDEIAIIGSHNFDPRGITTNTEVTLTVTDKVFAKELSESIGFATKPQNSWLIAKRQRVPFIGYITEVFETVSRLLPVFDLWPFRYTSSFELRDGKQQVNFDDPEFYENYEDVGLFPGTAWTENQIKTLLIAGFGSLAEPLL